VIQSDFGGDWDDGSDDPLDDIPSYDHSVRLSIVNEATDLHMTGGAEGCFDDTVCPRCGELAEHDIMNDRWLCPVH